MTEAALVQERVNAALVTEALLLQACVGSLLDKQLGKHFKTLIRSLSVEAELAGDDNEPP